MSRKTVLAFVLIIVLLVCLGTFVPGLQDRGTGPALAANCYSLSCIAFVTRDSDTDYFSYMPGLSIMDTNIEEYEFFFAPVHLPDGAAIRQVQVRYYDDHAEDIEVSLARSWYSGTTAYPLEFATSGAVSNWRIMISPTRNIPVDNFSSTYAVAVLLYKGDNHRIQWVKVYYDSP